MKTEKKITRDFTSPSAYAMSHERDRTLFRLRAPRATDDSRIKHKVLSAGRPRRPGREGEGEAFGTYARTGRPETRLGRIVVAVPDGTD